VSIDALLALLARDAEADAANLVSAAESQARELLSRADAATQRRREDALHRLEETRRQAVSCETAAAARQYRELRLLERARVLDRIFAEAERELRTASAGRYERHLPILMRATLRYLEGTPAVISCRPEIIARVEQLCAQQTDVSVRANDQAVAGILGESANGAVAVDNTLPALLRRREKELVVAVAARLEAM
jgi:vacuolar-type H+-ATPase subunit E/Vma4